MTTVAFIGAGNIARAIMGGFTAADPDAIVLATDPMPEQLELLPPGVSGSSDNVAAVDQADVVVLCVKPDKMSEICRGLRDVAGNRLFISVAAGITTGNLRNWLGAGPAIVRCMPNTPALVGAGMTGLFAAAGLSQGYRAAAESLLGAVGEVCWFNQEADLDLVTAVSGSGPAYFFLLIEAMQEAAVSLGLDAKVARLLAEQTALGAATMASQGDLDASVLRENVTSPGGTTAAALNVFAQEGFKQIVQEALAAAAQRSKELSAP